MTIQLRDTTKSALGSAVTSIAAYYFAEQFFPDHKFTAMVAAPIAFLVLRDTVESISNEQLTINN
jgi:hypothetical protein